MGDEERREGERRVMVDSQIESRGVRDPRVLAALLAVPRHQFVNPGDEYRAYADSALPTSQGQTISQPYMVALMCELLEVAPHHKVLEVGAGSGYQAAVLGQLAAEVYAVEIIPALAQRAAAVVAKLGCDNVHIIEGDGSEGYPPEAPYDRIIVAAGAERVPEPLTDQLAIGGRLVAPVGDGTVQTCLSGIREADGSLSYEQGIACVFVPLVGRHGRQPARAV
jgi:protein-L-isoaspartate(D-aspartate) O-methyltransferase